MTTKEILSELHRQIRLSNAPRFADNLGKLVASEPVRCLRLLFDDRILPEPYIKNGSDDFHVRHKFLSESIKHVQNKNLISQDVLEELQDILDAANYVRTRMESIVTRLREIPLTKETHATQFYYLGEVIENQYSAVLNYAKNQSSLDALPDRTIGMQAFISSSEGNPDFSPVDVYEGTVTATELAVRFILHQSSTSQSGQVNFAEASYGQAIAVLKLANIWKNLESLWEDVRYARWRPKNRGTGDIVYSPRSEEQVVEMAASRNREQRYLIGLSEPSQILESQHSKYIALASESLNMKAGLNYWDGNIDTEALKKASTFSTFLRAAYEIIEQRYFQSFITKIKIKDYPNNAGWEELLRVTNFIRDLADSMRLACNRVNDEAIGTRVSPIFIATEDNIVSACLRVTGLSDSLCRAVLKQLIFNRTMKSLDMWDQPLLPLGGGQIMVIPSVVTAGHPRSLIEDFLLQHEGANVFDLRNQFFEQRIAEIMEQGDGATAVTNVAFFASDGSEVEYDVIVWWDGFLFLLEAKCQRSAFDSADDYRILTKVEESIDQLTRRRRLLETDWCKIQEKAREKNPNMLLPPIPPGSSNIVCISVLNSFRYTGMQQDGIVVTDDVCLNRYFGDPNNFLSMTQGNARVQIAAGRIRKGEKATANDLFAYLANPPQIALIKQDIKIGCYKISQINDEPVLCYIAGRYTGNNEKMMASLDLDSDALVSELGVMLDAANAMT